MTVATIVDCGDADGDLLAAAGPYELRFRTRFTTLVLFSGELPSDLHRPGARPDSVRDASASDVAIVERVQTITKVANLSAPTVADRARYLRCLDEIFARLTASPIEAAADAELVIAPRREGRILAERLGCLPATAEWTPEAKRISVPHGLLIGFDTRPTRPVTGRITVIDGVLASGGTLMAALQLAAGEGAVVDVFACHSTAAGAAALARYAERLGQRLTLHVGHVSGRLNDHFYAVDPADPTQLVLGDVGDTISDIATSQRHDHDRDPF